MVDESMDKEQMAKPPQPWEFRSKKAWQRLLIMMGGIIVNVLLAFFIYAMVLFVWGEKKLPMSSFENGLIVNDSFAYEIGFKDGDKIIAADGKPVVYYNDLMAQVLLAREVSIIRDGKPETIHFPEDLLGTLSSRNKLNPLFSIPFPAIIDSIIPGSGAQRGGLLQNDKFVSINAVPTSNMKAVRAQIKANIGGTIDVIVLRNNIEVPLKIAVSDSGSIGFNPAAPASINDLDRFGYKLEVYKYGFFESFPAGVAMTGDKLSMYIQQFKKIINPSTGAYKGIGGFASMTKLYDTTWNWEQFWTMTAFISIMLAFMNFLPIPGLDGGYVMFALYEMITRRKPNEKFLEIATTIGLVLLLMLMLYANGMDVVRAFR